MPAGPVADEHREGLPATVAVIVGEGPVRAVGEITGVSVRRDRVALEGMVLAEDGHPVR